METSVKFAETSVDNSITNPNTVNALDNDTPFTFIEFLNNTNTTHTPSAYNELYIQYVRSWYNTKRLQTTTEEEFVQKQYVELLKELTITYSTDDERRFFQNINFDDPEDLEIVIPFYARKIKEIVLFYKDRRDKLKFVVERNKRKTTEFSIERAAKQTIIDYLFDSNTSTQLGIDINSVINNLQIDVEELVDVFGSYLDLSSPPADYGSDDRETFFTSNINEITTDILDINDSIRKQLFGNVFLKELGVAFTINVNLNYDPICQPSNPIGEYIKSKTINGVDPSAATELYKDLLEKYIGVDFYYIQKDTNGSVLSGKLLTASNPSGNLVNIRNASTATVPSDQLVALKKVGLFFNKGNTGILRFNSNSFTYTIDSDKVQNGETYVYPDPEVYGSSADPLVFNIDNTSNLKSISNSNATGDVISTPQDQSFYTYYSNEQVFESSNINQNGLFDKFTQLYNEGYCYDWKEDVYGNEYGIFKDQLGQYSHGKLSLENITGDNYFVKLLVFNGWLFSDFTPASSQAVFDMSGPYVGLNDVYMSGLSTNGGDFTPVSDQYYLNFRAFTPYQGIPSDYGLYPILDDQRVLLDAQVLDSNRTIVSTQTGSDLYNSVVEKYNLNGKLFVKNAITNIVSPLSTALSATFFKYPAAVKTEVYENVKGFELYYNTLVIYTDNYIVIDQVKYDTDGFESPTTNNVYLTGNSSLNKISNTFFLPKYNEVFFFVTSVSGNELDSFKPIIPTFYSYNINNSKLTKLYPTPNTSYSSVLDNFSFYSIRNTDFINTPVNIINIGSARLTYNSYNDIFSLVFVGKDPNNSPYVFDIKLKYQNPEITVDSTNVYDINSSEFVKVTNNLFNTYTYSNGYQYLVSLPSNGSPPTALASTSLDLTFNSINNTPVTANLSTGVLII